MLDFTCTYLRVSNILRLCSWNQNIQEVVKTDFWLWLHTSLSEIERKFFVFVGILEKGDGFTL